MECLYHPSRGLCTLKWIFRMALIATITDRWKFYRETVIPSAAVRDEFIEVSLVELWRDPPNCEKANEVEATRIRGHRFDQVAVRFSRSAGLLG